MVFFMAGLARFKDCGFPNRGGGGGSPEGGGGIPGGGGGIPGGGGGIPGGGGGMPGGGGGGGGIPGRRPKGGGGGMPPKEGGGPIPGRSTGAMEDTCAEKPGWKVTRSISSASVNSVKSTLKQVGCQSLSYTWTQSQVEPFDFEYTNTLTSSFL